MTPQPATAVEIHRLSFPKGDGIPNNPDYPAVLAPDALGGTHDDGEMKALLEANGWGGTWTWRVYDFHHFHPDAFEVLAVAHGSATLVLGGPQGKEIEVKAGDVMILPPGFGHRQIEMSKASASAAPIRPDRRTTPSSAPKKAMTMPRCGRSGRRKRRRPIRYGAATGRCCKRFSIETDRRVSRQQGSQRRDQLLRPVVQPGRGQPQPYHHQLP